jgi:glycine cleavage system H protein
VEVPDGLRYTEDHEWLRQEDGDAVIGITAYAADELGDVVFVELPAVGRTFAAREVFGVIESVKTASDLFCPIAGEVVAVNEALNGGPELVNSDPYGQGWMIRLRPTDPSAAEAILDAAAYRAIIGA